MSHHTLGTTRKTLEHIQRLKQVYAKGGNVMEEARILQKTSMNTLESILIAYDLQSGSYVNSALADPESHSRKLDTVAEALVPYVSEGSTICEAGVGEATTLSGVIGKMPFVGQPFGFDLSWSRLFVGRQWLLRNAIKARLVVGDLFRAPFQDAAIDVVYTCHSVEPNGGREGEALSELLRIARHFLVLIEPVYEFGDSQAKARMDSHGYVRNLLGTLQDLGANVLEYRPLPGLSHKLNPSGLIAVGISNTGSRDLTWQCPVSGDALQDLGDCFFASEAGLAYPVLREIPLLRPEHAVIASSLHRPVLDLGHL